MPEIQPEWSIEFGRAMTLLKEEIDKMIHCSVYEDPQRFFKWAVKTTNKVRKISSICDGSEVALKSCDEINLIGESYLDGIINQAGAFGIVSEVDARGSKRYTAAVVLSMYLEQMSLLMRETSDR